MLKNYWKTAWRNIRRNKLHATIHIFGLGIAFSICTLLFLTAYFQLSYDSFHSDETRLFRTSIFKNSVNGLELTTQMPLPLQSSLKTDIPEIEGAIRVNMGRIENISYGDTNFERMVTRTDPGFFEMFNFPVVIGNKKTALTGLQDIALSESLAKTIFGNENPIGKQLKIGKVGEEKNFTVSALIKDCPKNSSIRFDAVARIESLNYFESQKNDWGAASTNLFVKIAKNSNQQLVEKKLVPFSEKYYKDQIEQLKTEHPEGTESHDVLSINLTQMEDIHFTGEKSAPIALVYALICLGAFILSIACFNFVNLNMANSFKRSRELGVRKTMGAYRGQLFLQLWGEAFLLYFIGFLVGIFITSQLVPLLNDQLDANLPLSTLFEPSFLVVISLIFLGVTLVAGGYPALKMCNFSLVEILKGNISTQKPGAFRNSLLISQFAISSLLICISWIASEQLDYLRQKPIGFDKEQMISIPVGNRQDGRKVLDRMRNELANDPAILSISGSESNLGRGKDKVTSRTTLGFDYNENQVSADWILVDFDYLKTLQIPIVQGRDFNKEYANDTGNAVVVTESFVTALGEPEPIGKFFGGDDVASGHQIIGVIPDFNAYSPSEKSLPIALHLSTTQPIYYLFLKVQADDPELAMKHIATVWDKVTSNSQFDASFLNENLQAWYEGESVMTTIFGIASGVAIFLSCLGLFAISLLIIELRTKEIGIRKVMGASVNAIVSMISFHFLKLVVISLLIALPLAWFAMQKWIETYEYRMGINPLTFITVGFLVAAIALITVSFHSIKAALANPVKSLRAE